MTDVKLSDVHVIILAAGVGRRFTQTDLTHNSIAKQHRNIGNKPMLAHSITAFDDIHVSHVVVATNANDSHDIKPTDLSSKHPIHTTHGGDQRHDSVRNGLKFLIHDLDVSPDDWVLVHDAARPCVSIDEIQALVDACIHAQQGGLLVKPCNDTIKLSSDGVYVEKTLNRDQLFAALTPQMFRCNQLLKALTVYEAGSITDESSALEAQGVKPIMVVGKNTNIKVTSYEDLAMATAILKQQGRTK